jgi:acyl-CoA hydrolase
MPRFVAINAAAEVDLFGQVNGERVGGTIQAGAGGLPAFAQGALSSPGGRLLICLGATARKGSVSRIVPVLGEQSLCTLPRYLADAVVTEHGVAELRHLSLDARAEALIGIAAPEHRAALQDAWRALRKSA